MPTLSAANRLRIEVLAVPGTVLLSQAGIPDKVIRYQKVPDPIEKLKADNSIYQTRSHYTVNLDRGPDQEAWRDAQREVFLQARRDKPVPEPVSVAENSHEEWSVGNEDVPMVENAIVLPAAVREAAPQPINFTCIDCTRSDFSSEQALKIHRGRAHK